MHHVSHNLPGRCLHSTLNSSESIPYTKNYAVQANVQALPERFQHYCKHMHAWKDNAIKSARTGVLVYNLEMDSAQWNAKYTSSGIHTCGSVYALGHLDHQNLLLAICTCIQKWMHAYSIVTVLWTSMGHSHLAKQGSWQGGPYSCPCTLAPTNCHEKINQCSSARKRWYNGRQQDQRNFRTFITNTMPSRFKKDAYNSHKKQAE